MSIRIVQLGTPRQRDEGLRIGTVRRPPRGVPRSEFALRNFYDVWLPILAPSQPLVTLALMSTDEKSWRTFERKYRAEMARPDARRTVDLLAALSHQTNFSVGCYCENAERCHRSILAALLVECGARPG
ncbi:MAG: h16 [Gemmatimonadetes bacterium]|nr:h16 [Gemmatimonadota bacterium]